MAKFWGFHGPVFFRLVVVLLLGWAFVFFCFVKPLLSSSDDSHSVRSEDKYDHPKTMERLENAIKEIDGMRKLNEHLHQLIKNIRNEGNEGLPEYDEEKLLGKDVPDDSYELRLRRLLVDIQEINFFMMGQLKKLSEPIENNPKAAHNLVEKLLQRAKEQQKYLNHDLQELKIRDGYEKWREEESGKLRDLVRRRIHYLQNPKDCNNAKKLICNLNKSCGYGCQVHHVTYCLIVAYATKRTMILNSKNWRYSKSGWEKVFLPVSETCVDANGESRRGWPGTLETQVVDLPIIDMISPRPSYLPPAVPKDLAQRISKIHGDPSAWWVSQFLGYLVRYQPDTTKMLNDTAKAFGFQNPIVGVHVRRTDKVGTEAAFHSVAEYMEHVKDYYDLLEVTRPGVERRVYLASDDPTVLPNAISSYPDYKFLGDPDIAKGAAVATRYSDSSLRGILTDIHFLAHSDFLVCTFSSQVCRVAYEMMQTMHTDASARFRSLDDIYYFGGGGGRQLRARFSHRAVDSEEISFDIGEALGIAGNHWDGFSRGQNYKTRQTGLFPSYKAEIFVEEVELPTYPEVLEED